MGGGKGGFLAPQNHLLQVDGAHKPGKAVHLGEGKLQFQTSAALWPHPAMEKASGAKLQEKPGVWPLRWLDCQP